MFTVKARTSFGWIIKEADEVRVGKTPDGEPTVIIDTCRRGGGQEMIIVTPDDRKAHERAELANIAYIENASGKTTHTVYPLACIDQPATS